MLTSRTIRPSTWQTTIERKAQVYTLEDEEKKSGVRKESEVHICVGNDDC